MWNQIGSTIFPTQKVILHYIATLYSSTCGTILVPHVRGTTLLPHVESHWFHLVLQRIKYVLGKWFHKLEPISIFWENDSTFTSGTTMVPLGFP